MAMIRNHYITAVLKNGEQINFADDDVNTYGTNALMSFQNGGDIHTFDQDGREVFIPHHAICSVGVWSQAFTYTAPADEMCPVSGPECDLPCLTNITFTEDPEQAFQPLTPAYSCETTEYTTGTVTGPTVYIKPEGIVEEMGEFSTSTSSPLPAVYDTQLEAFAVSLHPTEADTTFTIGYGISDDCYKEYTITIHKGSSES